MRKAFLPVILFFGLLPAISGATCDGLRELENQDPWADVATTDFTRQNLEKLGLQISLERGTAGDRLRFSGGPAGPQSIDLPGTLKAIQLIQKSGGPAGDVPTWILIIRAGDADSRPLFFNMDPRGEIIFPD